MPAGTTALNVVAVAVPTMWLAVFCDLATLTDRDDAISDGALPSTEFLDRVVSEGTPRTDSWQHDPSHRASSAPYTPEQARTEMRRHCECGTDLCAAKYEAFWTLVDAGHAVPDARAAR